MTIAYSGDSITFPDNSVQNTAATGFGFKNRIINGQMVIDQRNAGTSVTATGAYTLDRFLNYRSGGAYTVQRSTTAPAGFINSMLMTNTTAASPTTYSFFAQPIEGLNVSDLAFGTANAATITISFWARSSVAGIYSISVTNSNGDRAYPAQYTINAANTFEYKTITVLGDVSGSWLTNNSTGINLRFDLGSPSARTAASGAWASGNYDGANGSTGATTWANTTGATFYITGVQLEKGSTATSFDYRPYGTELALCQRYTVSYGGTTAYESVALGYANATTTAIAKTFLPVEMRATPTVTSSASGTFGLYDGVAVTSVTAITSDQSSPKIFNAIYTVASGLTTYRPVGVVGNNNTSARLLLSAEL